LQEDADAKASEGDLYTLEAFSFFIHHLPLPKILFEDEKQLINSEGLK
jgi:hypothetical protein